VPADDGAAAPPDEAGNWFDVDVDDHAFADARLAWAGILAQVSSSWASRSNATICCKSRSTDSRSAVCGMHRCFVQPLTADAEASVSTRNPQPMVFDEQWLEIPEVDRSGTATARAGNCSCGMCGGGFAVSGAAARRR